VAAAIWGGTVLWHAHQTAQRDAANAAAGADALHDARQDIATLNTMDYRRVGADFQAWLSASTGTLNSQLAQSAAGLKQQFVATRAVTSGTITKARVAVADAAAGTATILGTEDQLVSFGSTHTTKHNGFDAQVSLTAAGWRLTSFTTAPITK
jgi:Mce-associated membrane protein